ncbi:MAG: hypothetical protein M1834_004624 [Cirrosporium novae-zelandiae]|nr:MAG: hypothetical protein M1834_004624 [Cirrosporium novae-zelandiae]
MAPTEDDSGAHPKMPLPISTSTFFSNAPDPRTYAQWRTAVLGVKLLYQKRQYKACISRCSELLSLESLNQSVSLALAFGPCNPSYILLPLVKDLLLIFFQAHSLQRVFIQFYQATSLELLARSTHNMNGRKLPLLNEARTAYVKTAALLSIITSQDLQESTANEFRVSICGHGTPAIGKDDLHMEPEFQFQDTPSPLARKSTGNRMTPVLGAPFSIRVDKNKPRTPSIITRRRSLDTSKAKDKRALMPLPLNIAGRHTPSPAPLPTPLPSPPQAADVLLPLPLNICKKPLTLKKSVRFSPSTAAISLSIDTPQASPSTSRSSIITQDDDETTPTSIPALTPRALSFSRRPLPQSPVKAFTSTEPTMHADFQSWPQENRPTSLAYIETAQSLHSQITTYHLPLVDSLITSCLHSRSASPSPTEPTPPAGLGGRQASYWSFDPSQEDGLKVRMQGGRQSKWKRDRGEWMNKIIKVRELVDKAWQDMGY